MLKYSIITAVAFIAFGFIGAVLTLGIIIAFHVSKEKQA